MTGMGRLVQLGTWVTPLSGHMSDTALKRNDRPRPLVQNPEAKRPDMHELQAVLNSTQADNLADEHGLAVPLHAAIVTNTARLEASSVAALRLFRCRVR